jgi:5-methylcytosine-specific restriction endonuclease McrA
MFAKRSTTRLRANGTGRRVVNSYATQDGWTIRNSWWDLRAKVVERSGNRCEARGCTNPLEEVHHIRPLSQGGLNVLSNLIGLCRACHDKRHRHLAKSR